jgi:hypothetical protein
MRIRLPPVNSLAADVAEALFRLTVGDVQVTAPGVYEIVSWEKFGNKLSAFVDRARDVGAKFSNLLGGCYVAKACGVGTIQELAAKAASDPEGLVSDIEQFKINRGTSAVEVRWGSPPFVPPEFAPPLLASVEFMEGARLWPATQLEVSGSGRRKRIKEGYARDIYIGCRLMGGLALGFSAVYVSGSQWEGSIRLLIPLSPVEYSPKIKDLKGAPLSKMAKANCDLPEPLLRALVVSLSERPAVYRYVSIRYRVKKECKGKGGKEVEREKSYEVLINVNSLREASLLFREYGDVFTSLAAEWCRCDRGGWQAEGCGEVEALGEAVRSVYLYAESGLREEAYRALSLLVRLAGGRYGHIARGLVDLVKRLQDYVS